MPNCFVIAPIGEEGDSIRARSDKILNHVIKPVAKECGFDAVRADKISEPGLITTQVIDHILNDPMVVADLTDNNANVFYELAIRHTFRKPYVQIIRKGQRKPFDVATLRTIEIDHTDLDSVDNAKNEIRTQMMFLMKDPTKIESPISVAIDTEKLRKSDDPGQRQLAEILNQITDLKASIAKRLDDTNLRLARIVAILMSSGRLPEPLKQAIAGQFKEDMEQRVGDMSLRLDELLRQAHKKGTPDDQTG